MSSMYFQLASLCYMTVILYVFFSKRRIRNIETKIYSIISIVNIIGIGIDIFIVYLSNVVPHFKGLYIINKIYLLYILIWMALFFQYILSVTVYERENLFKKLSKLNVWIAIGSIIIVLIIPIKLFFKGDVIIYTHGPSVSYLYGICVVYFLLITCVLFINIKNLIIKKYIPVFSLVTLMLIAFVVRQIDPSVLLTTAIITFITIFMYHTIENPDMKLIKELEIAKERADKANIAKTDFLSNMSHEIRTPLHAITGFSQTLSERRLPESIKEDVKDIMIASESLLEIVNSILDISKIEANKLEIVNKEYNFKEVLTELESLTKGRIGDKPIELRCNFDQSIPDVLYGDYVRIKQIIVNLLTNSAKYTKEGHINFNVNCFVKGDYCRLIISVEDSGIGIKKENIDKLFNKFERVDLENNISIEGTGLGLAITKKLVELMNGQIVVQSVYGSGSKFTVAINQKIVKNPTLKNKVVEEIDYENIDLSSKRVLVVDDNRINIKVAKKLLEKYGVNVDSVESGFACIEKINAKEHYDLIFLDDMMPKMSGVQTLKKMKVKEDFNIKTIALTANALTGMKEKYISEGFTDYLAKPIDRDELDKIISKYLLDK